MSEVLNESVKDLNNLAFKVLQEYDITPKNLSIVQSGAIKTIWKFRTSNKNLCLKRLRQTYDKALFSVNAQIYINNSNGNVPEIILTAKNQPILQYNGQLFVIYEWLEGKDLDFNNNLDLKNALTGLAIFHKKSKGYIPSKDSRESSKFGRWPQQYTSMQNRFKTWRNLASDKKSNESHSIYLDYVNSMIEISNFALEQIEKSQYKNLSMPGSDLKVLCHQDFGRGNVISTPNGIFVLDLDSVTFDFSARDLRKIIGKFAATEGRLDINLMNNILSWYSKENPLCDDEKRLLYIDLLFPHWFHGLVKDQYLNDNLINPAVIQKKAEFEKSKALTIKKLLE